MSNRGRHHSDQEESDYERSNPGWRNSGRRPQHYNAHQDHGHNYMQQHISDHNIIGGPPGHNYIIGHNYQQVPPPNWIPPNFYQTAPPMWTSAGHPPIPQRSHSYESPNGPHQYRPPGPNYLYDYPPNRLQVASQEPYQTHYWADMSPQVLPNYHLPPSGQNSHGPHYFRGPVPNYGYNWHGIGPPHGPPTGSNNNGHIQHYHRVPVVPATVPATIPPPLPASLPAPVPSEEDSTQTHPLPTRTPSPRHITNKYIVAPRSSSPS